MLRRGALALLLAGLVLAGCGDDEEEPAATGEPAAEEPAGGPEEWTGSDADFYVPPDPLPDGEHGDLLRYQPLDDGTTKVLYLSESVPGEPIAVSGIVALPPDVEGPVPVLSWAHGTTGLADECAPSKTPADQRFRRFIDEGMAVVATDYEGLGTPGLHPYIAGISEGRGTLDIVRAAQQLPDSNAGDEVVLWGHSQGGHAVLFANQIAGEWTPELDIVGTVAGAPPSQLPLLSAALQGGNFQGYIAMAAGGLNAAYPDEADLSLVITPAGLEKMDVLEQGCTSDVFAEFNSVSYEEFAKADPTTVPAWRKILEENDPGHVKTETPILIIHGEADEQIPVVSSQLLMDRMCGLGQVVERRTYPGQGHAEVIVPSFDDMVDWMLARLDGEPAVTDCKPS